jgi:hypothetical protein
MPLSVPTVCYELNYRRKKVKTHTSQGIVKNKCTKPTKEWLDVAIWLNILIFDCGNIPESWVIGKIKPIYKNKGDSSEPKNYRPITILS